MPIRLQDSLSRSGVFVSILIVDDEVELVSCLVDALKEVGIQAKGCHSMLEALTMIRLEKFELMLLDYGLIERRCHAACDSCDLSLPELWNIQIVYMSGKALSERKFNCIDAYLEKPFSIDELKKLYYTAA